MRLACCSLYAPEVGVQDDEEGEGDSREEWEGDKSKEVDDLGGTIRAAVSEAGGDSVANISRDELVDVLVDGNRKAEE